MYIDSTTGIMTVVFLILYMFMSRLVVLNSLIASS